MATFFSTRVSRRTFVAGLATATVVGARGPLTFAQAAPFAGGGQVQNGYQYAAGPYAVKYKNTLYVYGTGADGTGYYSTYDGTTYAPAQAYPSQPAKYQGRPCAYVYGDKQYVYYYGQDNKYYAYVYDGQSYAAPQDVSGGYAYAAPPYGVTYQNKLYLYGVASDGNLYAQAYDGSDYGAPEKVNGAEQAGAWAPYAVEYGGYANIFYVAKDGKVYWNRYDGSAYVGAKALPGDGTYGYAPYAIADPTDEARLYAYAATTDGTPSYNIFTPGQGWGGFTAYPTPPAAKVAQYQPSAYVYQGAQHIVYPGVDYHAYYATYQNGSYSAYVDLGANYAYEPVQYEYAGGYYLTYTGQDGYVYYKTYSGGGNKAAAPNTPTPPYGGYQVTPTPTPSY